MLSKKLVIHYLEFVFKLLNQPMEHEIDAALMTKCTEPIIERGLTTPPGLLAPLRGPIWNQIMADLENILRIKGLEEAAKQEIDSPPGY